ncbi:hypothetical protein QTP88_016280 [Uroleucon formosanum]
MYSRTPTNFLRLQKVNLHGPSTIRRWIGESKFLPGFSTSLFSHIQKKIENKSTIDKICSISFDKIYIKEFSESKDYDFIEGFKDFGHYGRSKKTANPVMVFMARGIYTSWKIPVAYFLEHSGVNHKLLKNLIVDVISELLKIALCPKMLVCDQGTNNQKEKSGNAVTFVLTNRLNQDALENKFSVIRQKGGYNKNPTARTIRTSIRSTCIFSLCTSKGVNCEDIDDDEEEPNNHKLILLNTDQSKINENSSDTEESLSISINSTTSSNSSSEKYSKSTVSLENFSVTYFAGYLAFKCIKKINCKYCECELITEKLLDEKNQLLVLNKNYFSLDTGLKAPTKDFNNIIDRILNILKKNLIIYSIEKKIGNS